MFFSQIAYENSPLYTQICEAATIFLAFCIFHLKYAHNSIFNFTPKKTAAFFIKEQNFVFENGVYHAGSWRNKFLSEIMKYHLIEHFKIFAFISDHLIRYILAYRRRMDLEDKAKVVALVWEADFVQFLVALAILPQPIWK